MNNTKIRSLLFSLYCLSKTTKLRTFPKKLLRTVRILINQGLSFLFDCEHKQKFRILRK